MSGWRENLIETMNCIRERTSFLPALGVILGSGLGSCLSRVNVDSTFSFSELPHYPSTSVEGHRGELVLGRIYSKNLALMRGRVHYYEGHSIEDVAYPVRVLHALGAEALIVTNACGAVNPDFSPGDIMMIEDHINFMGANPLVGQDTPDGAERFPDMTRCYDAEYMRLAEEAAPGAGIELRKGVLMAFSGPSYETPAEIIMARNLGADAVTMSTVPEVIVARQLGMRVLGFSCVTNMAAGVLERPLEHGEVLQVTEAAADKFDFLLSFIIPHLP